MRWPWRYRPHPADREGIEMAKKALNNAQAIESHAERLELEIRTIQRANHLGPKIHRALGGD